MPIPLWERFSVSQSVCSEEAATWLVLSHVDVSIRPLATSRDTIERICSSAAHPIPIVSICQELTTASSARGDTLSGYVGDLIDDIVKRSERLSWWVEANGLSIGVAPLGSERGFKTLRV